MALDFSGLFTNALRYSGTKGAIESLSVIDKTLFTSHEQRLIIKIKARIMFVFFIMKVQLY